MTTAALVNERVGGELKKMSLSIAVRCPLPSYSIFHPAGE